MKPTNLAVAVTRDIPDHRVFGRPFVKPVDRHQWKQLLDGPAVRDGLKQREIAEIGITQDPVQSVQLVGRVVELTDQAPDFATGGPVQAFCQTALIQREIA